MSKLSDLTERERMSVRIVINMAKEWLEKPERRHPADVARNTNAIETVEAMLAGKEADEVVPTRQETLRAMLEASSVELTLLSEEVDRLSVEERKIHLHHQTKVYQRNAVSSAIDSLRQAIASIKRQEGADADPG